MAVKTQNITDKFALYNGDCCEVLKTLPDECVDLSVYSPPFCGLYNYSSDERDMSNCKGYDEFFEHYRYLLREIGRVTKPGRISAVHCMDVPSSGSSASIGGYTDFPGDIIRLHESEGWEFWTRRAIWKEPLAVRLRTMAKGLAHKQIVDDASLTTVASADYVIEFRKKGENQIPVTYDHGMTKYCGEKVMPAELQKYKNWQGKQTENRYSHWIWRNYASSIWDDIRIDNVLPYKECKEPDDEKHVHPLQLDVIERIVQLRSNPGETVLTPFLGVGSEAYGALVNGRKAIGVELKSAYYKQAVKNCEEASAGILDQPELF